MWFWRYTEIISWLQTSWGDAFWSRGIAGRRATAAWAWGDAGRVPSAHPQHPNISLPGGGLGPVGSTRRWGSAIPRDPKGRAGEGWAGATPAGYCPDGATFARSLQQTECPVEKATRVHPHVCVHSCTSAAERTGQATAAGQCWSRLGAWSPSPNPLVPGTSGNLEPGCCLPGTTKSPGSLMSISLQSHLFPRAGKDGCHQPGMGAVKVGDFRELTMDGEDPSEPRGPACHVPAACWPLVTTLGETFSHCMHGAGHGGGRGTSPR